MRRKALLICYYFPPLGLGGVGRPLNLFKQLPGCGWACDILTVKSVLYRAYEPELLDGLDTSRIYRAGSRDPQRLLWLAGVRKIKADTIARGRSVAEKYFPDSKVGWVKPAVRLARRRHRSKRYDIIISTSPPVSSHLIARQMKADYGLPWIADFRDYWTVRKVEEAFDDPRRVTKGKELLAQISREASAVTTVNETIASYLGGAEVITNGYDADFAEAWRQPPDPDRFTIGLLGHQHDAREVEPLLRVLDKLRARFPEQFDRLCILQVGEVDREWFGQLLRQHDLTEKVVLRGRCRRRETIEVLSKAHMFYLGIPEAGGGAFLPNRLFELAASGRPIIARAAPESETGRFLAGIEKARCFDESDSDRAVDLISEQIRRFEQKQYEFIPLSEQVRRYSSQAMGRKFAELMDRLS